MSDNPRSDLTLTEPSIAIRKNTSAYYESLARVSGAPIGRFGTILATADYAVICNQSDFSWIDDLLNWYRQHGTQKAPILYWICASDHTTINAKLLARGVSPNWKPNWMWYDIESVHLGVLTPKVDIKVSRYSRSTRPIPNQVETIEAWKDDEVVGKCMLAFTGGEHASAGVFDMCVKEEHRRQGVGTALCHAALDLAKEREWESVYLNATPDGQQLYSRVGFVPIAHGQSWHLRTAFSTTKPNDQDVMQAIECIVSGDVESLEIVLDRSNYASERHFDKPTANGLTPFEHAAHAEQTEVAKFLMEYGIWPDLVSLYKLGLKDDAAQWLQDVPGLANFRSGQSGATPLHYAVQQDDLELAQMLLSSYDCDLTLKDDVYQSTAAGWAQYMRRPMLLQMIQTEKHRQDREKVEDVLGSGGYQ